MTADDIAKLAVMSVDFEQFRQRLDDVIRQEANERRKTDRFLDKELRGPAGQD